jgi:O-antigen/teichoic acid export membrane protein
MVKKSIFWSFFSQMSTQLISFSISLILVRILTPEIFGLIAITYIFYSLSEVLLDSGMSVSIIRSDNISINELNSVFTFNFITGVFLYLILFITSPIIASYYDLPQLSFILRITGISIIFNSLVLVQKAIFTKNLDFKKIALINLSTIIFSGVIGILIAYLYKNFWSLVALNVFSAFFTLLFYWSLGSWKPKFYFSINNVKKHFQFGYKLSLSSVLDVISTNIYYNIIGIYYATTQVGLFAKADSLKRMAIMGISTPLKTVLLPLFSKIKDDLERLRMVYIVVLRIILLIVSFFLFFLIFNAYEIFYLLFGEKWLDGVVFFKIICIAAILYPINTYVVNFLLVVGRSDLVLRFEFIKKVFLFISIILSLYYHNIIILIYSLILSALFDLILNLWIIKKYLHISILKQIKIFSTVMINLIVVFIVDFLFNYFLDISLINENLFIAYSLKSFLFFIMYFTFTSIISFFLFKDTLQFLKKHLK